MQLSTCNFIQFIGAFDIEATWNRCSLLVLICLLLSRAYKEKQKAKQATKKTAPVQSQKTKAKGAKAPKAGGRKAPGRVGGKR